MTEKNRWPTIHAYRKLVARGKALPIGCPSDGTEFVALVSANTGIDPLFWCPTCDTTMEPGIDLWDQMEKAVDDEN